MTEITRRAGRFAVLATVLAAAAGLAVHVPSSHAASSARGFELVTPPGSDPADVTPSLPLPSGDGAIFQTADGLLGAPAGVWNTFAATRDADGWQNAWLTSATPRSADTSASLGNSAFANLPIGVSADGRRVFERTVVQLSPRDTNAVSDLYVLEDGQATLLTHDESGDATGLAGTSLFDDVRGGVATFIPFQHDVAVMAPDASRAIVTVPGTNALVAAANPASFGLYAIDADGTVQLVDGDVDARDAYRSTSDDGSVVAYVSGGKLRVWDGTASTAVADATDGDLTARVTADGATVFVTTSEQLDGSAPVGVPSVYAYDVAGRGTTLLSPASATRGVRFLTASRDGSRIFFVSTDAFATGAGADDQNVYVVSGGTTALVADMGATTPLVRPGAFGSAPPLTFAIAPDASAALLLTDASLDVADANGVPDAYLWKAADGSLTRISASSTGESPDGLSIDFGDQPGAGFETGYGWYDANGDGPRVVSDDGQWAFFASTGALTDDAGRDGAVKLYGWHDGTLTLISPAGDGVGDALLVGTTPTARDVFFVAFDALLPADTDGTFADLYDARAGGGFPVTAPPSEPDCPAGGCPSLPPAAPPASAGFTGPDDPTPGAAPSTRIVVARRVRAYGTRAVVQVRVPNGGRLALRGQARGGALLGGVSRTVRRAGRVSLAVRLTATGRRQLARRHRLRVAVAATFAAQGAPTSSRTLAITFIQQTPPRAEKGRTR